MKHRVNMSGTGSYVSVAHALKGADEGIKHVIKMGFMTRNPSDSGDPNALETTFLSDHVLLDFKSLVAGDLDVNKIIKDCDFLKNIAVKHPEKLKKLVEAYTDFPLGFEKADAIAKEIGLTEEAAIKAGGGVAWLAVVLIVVIMSRACTDAGNGNPQRKPKA
jgi:hypothetical protein